MTTSKTFLLQFGLFFVLLVCSQKVYSEISYRQYRSIKGISEWIVKKFPQNKYVYVGIGASPTGIMAYLELKYGKSSILHLPFSHARFLEQTQYRERVQGEPYQRVLQQHFEQFLPEEKVKGRKILLIDYSVGGGSISHIRDQVAQFLERNRPSAQLESLALANGAGLINRLVERGHQVLPISRYQDMYFADQNYDFYRRHEKFKPHLMDPELEYEPPEKRVQEFEPREYLSNKKATLDALLSYDHLLVELKSFMMKDPGNVRLFIRSLFKGMKGSRPPIACRYLFIRNY